MIQKKITDDLLQRGASVRQINNSLNKNYLSKFMMEGGGNFVKKCFAL